MPLMTLHSKLARLGVGLFLSGSSRSSMTDLRSVKSGYLNSEDASNSKEQKKRGGGPKDPPPPERRRPRQNRPQTLQDSLERFDPGAKRVEPPAIYPTSSFGVGPFARFAPGPGTFSLALASRGPLDR